MLSLYMFVLCCVVFRAYGIPDAKMSEHSVHYSPVNMVNPTFFGSSFAEYTQQIKRKRNPQSHAVYKCVIRIKSAMQTAECVKSRCGAGSVQGFTVSSKF